MRLEFSIRPAGPEGVREEKIDLVTARSSDLFFACFLGDVVLIADGIDFSTRFGWVATLSFAAGFIETTKRAIQNGQAVLDFQEADEWVSMRSSEGHIYVAASYVRGIARVPQADLLEFARRSFVDLTEELYEKYPALRENEQLNWQLSHSASDLIWTYSE